MKSAGHYALLQANGMPFKDVVKAIRDEQAQYLRTQGTKKDYLILDVDGIDGGESYMDWKVVTDVEEATSG